MSTAQLKSYIKELENQHYKELYELWQELRLWHELFIANILTSWGASNLTFYGNGTFEFYWGMVQGTYEISGNQIRFIDDGGCETDEGFYAYSINENTLSLVLISDSCSPRNVTFPGDYWKN